MKKIERIINWIITIATAIGTAVAYILDKMPTQ